MIVIVSASVHRLPVVSAAPPPSNMSVSTISGGEGQVGMVDAPLSPVTLDVVVVEAVGEVDGAVNGPPVGASGQKSQLYFSCSLVAITSEKLENEIE